MSMSVEMTNPYHRRIRCASRAIVIAGALAVALFGPASALVAKDAVRLAPHRAVYDMALDESSGRDAIIAVRGRMVFDFAGSSCDGYTLNIRLVTEMTNRSGNATVNDLRSSTWEHGSGEQFRFNTTHYRDKQLTEVASGKAARKAADQGVTVEVIRPEAEQLRYPGAILFPTQHSVEILSAALKGQRIVQAKIFDGSEQGKKLYSTTAFIGKQQPPGSKTQVLTRIKNDDKLNALDSWPVTISYFDGSSPGEETPAYELSFWLYANGVSRKIIINYGDFAIRGSLKSLEFFTPTKCD